MSLARSVGSGQRLDAVYLATPAARLQQQGGTLSDVNDGGALSAGAGDQGVSYIVVAGVGWRGTQECSRRWPAGILTQQYTDTVLSQVKSAISTNSRK